MNKAVIYVRVSTEKQATAEKSLEIQKRVLTDYAKKHDLEIVRTFQEAHSAYKPGRPEFEAMIDFLRERDDVSGVLCYRVDRLSRNLQDYSCLEEMEGIEIICATESLPDESTSCFLSAIFTATYRFCSDQMSERVKDACRSKAVSGMYPGRAPIGYVKNTVKKTLEPDPAMAPIITKLFEMYASEDITLSQLVCQAKVLGLRIRTGDALGKSALHKLLSNPIYHGVIRWGGKLYPGLHDPIVPVDVFNKVQDCLHCSRPIERRRVDQIKPANT